MPTVIQENEPTLTLDWRNNFLEVGDTVVWPTRQSSSMWMSEGVIETIEWKLIWTRQGTPPSGKTENYWRAVIGVRNRKQNRIVYPDPDRITLISKTSAD